MRRTCAHAGCIRRPREIKRLYCCWRCYERDEQAAEPAHSKECDLAEIAADQADRAAEQLIGER